MNRLPLVGTCLAAVLACAESTQSADPANVVVRLPDADCHSGQSCTFDFGALEVGAGRVRALDILNQGGTDEVLTHVGLTGDGAFRLHVDNRGPLPAGGLLPLAISVTPPEPYAAEATLRVLSARGANMIQVRLRVTGMFLDLGVSPDCDFGDVVVGTTSAPCPVTLTNPGEVPAQVDYVGVDNLVFRAVSGGALPFFIPPGGTYSLEFVATPAAVGPAAGGFGFGRATQIVEGAAYLRVNGI